MKKVSKIILGTVLGLFLMSFSPVKLSQNSNAEAFTYRSMSNGAFSYNEKLSYRVHYGFLNAAVIKMEVGNKPIKVNGRQTYHIKANGRTLSTFDWMFKVRDRFETYIDQNALVPQKFKKAVQEDNYKDHDLVYFKHAKKNLYSSKAKGTIKMPQYTQDVISALYYARNLNFKNAKIGKEFPINVYLDEEIYNLKFKYAGKQTINSDIGKVKCYKLVPKLVVDRVFKNEDDMTVWITADENKIPVRVKAKIAVGSLKVDLTSYSNLKNPFSSKVKK